jgi:hypothetical protein
MYSEVRIFIKCTCFLIFFSITPANSQMLQDTNCLKLLKKEINYTYNLKFDNAGVVFGQIKRMYPDHPIVFLLRGITTYWKNYPLVHINPAHISFEDDLRQCIKLSESNHNPAFETEYLLANLCARGMLLMYYADNDLPMDLIPLATSTYKYIRMSFDHYKTCIDLNFFAGLYNYYRVAYPTLHPMYKSLAFPFPPGDKETGLMQLQTSAQNSLFLRADSYLSLAWINLYYENNYAESLKYCRTLHELYPDNSEYLAMYIKNLLLLKKYDEAESQIPASDEKVINYYNAQIKIFKGIINEKKYHKYKNAEVLYNQGITDIAKFGGYGNGYAAYAYFGLSRISETKGDKQAGRIYRKKAENLTDYKKIDFDN